MAVREPDKRPLRRNALAAVVLALAVTTLAVPAAADAPAVPGKPTGLRVVSAAHDQVTIGWDDPGDASITGHRILRRLRDSYEVGRFDVIEDNTGTADTTFTDTEITPGTRYVYRVNAVNSVGVSRQSTSPPPRQITTTTMTATGATAAKTTTTV
ncbi:fibronectin type III domain-containing protein [Candidatus Poriferisodalis sp.]|uniref:fibronectin type III domain-containing protein n=1 Tax=Candidatus Poriferisodalis sp. TaxID=3101277 RepID=UPI003B5B1CF3